jgi:hypothetical protein
MVLLVPWQPAIESKMPGVLFSYEQLMRGYFGKQGGEGMTVYILYYGRFVGLWLLAVVLLISAQWRSWQAGRKVKLLGGRYAERGSALDAEAASQAVGDL